MMCLHVVHYDVIVGVGYVGVRDLCRLLCDPKEGWRFAYAAIKGNFVCTIYP